MLRVIIWTATVWIIMVFFAGCTQQKTQVDRPQLSRNSANAQWARPDTPNVADVPKAKAPAITATTYYATGLLLEQQGDLNGAAEKFNRAIDLDNGNVAAYNRLGLVYTKLNKFDLAQDAFKSALQHQPGAAYLHNNLAFAYLIQRKYADAEAELKNALAISPNFPRAHVNLGIALARQGIYQEALKHFQAACSGSEANYNLAILIHADGKLDLAEKYYNAALRLNPKFTPAAKGLKQLQEDRRSLSQIKIADIGK